MRRRFTNITTHEKQAFVDTNVTRTLNLLEEATTAGVRAFVFTSSTSVFGRGLSAIVLRTSRFFPDEDDRKATRDAYEDDNVKANEFLYRRADIEDVVNAHLLALEKAPAIGFGRYIVSATTPFTSEDLQDLHTNAPAASRGACQAMSTSTPAADGRCSRTSIASTSTTVPVPNSAGVPATTSRA